MYNDSIYNHISFRCCRPRRKKLRRIPFFAPVSSSIVHAEAPKPGLAVYRSNRLLAQWPIAITLNSRSFDPIRSSHLFAEGNVEGWDQGLSQPEGEDELGASHKQLGHETLEERRWALLLDHVLDDLNTALRVLEVAVLDTGLDDIERRRDNQRGRGTRNRSDKVLQPSRLVVILKSVQVSLGERRTSEERERSRRITRGGPAPAPVQPEALVLDDADDAAAAEGLGVCLALDLEDVEGEEHDLADADHGAGEGGYHGPAGRGAKGAVEGVAVVLGDEITGKGLASVLVYTL